jgi:hypothetical protein
MGKAGWYPNWVVRPKGIQRAELRNSRHSGLQKLLQEILPPTFLMQAEGLPVSRRLA